MKPVPMTRKLFQMCGSYVVTLPKSWVQYAEQTSGKKMVAVAMEVNGKITLQPIFQNKQTPTSGHLAEECQASQPSNPSGEIGITD